jgi:hypothetical protein
MVAQITDKFRKASAGTRAEPTTLVAQKTIGATSISTAALNGWATDTAVDFQIYQTNTQGQIVAGTQSDWTGIVTGTSITQIQLQAGNDDNYPIGSVVVALPTAAWADDLVDGLAGPTGSINQDGSLKTTAVQAALNIGTTPADYNVLANAPDTIVYNGQRSYNITFNGVNYTDRVNPATRLRFVRTVAAPTQSTALNGTTQYWNNTSPNKMTFTDDFAVSAWVKVAAYPTSGFSTLVSRYNGTSGWSLLIDTDGVVYLVGYNGGTANFSRVLSVQSIPLNSWVHVTAQLDMSAFSATPTTSYIMFDGVDIPATVNRGGTNPTALVQAGNIEVGSRNGGVDRFNGKVAQVAVFSAKVTQATMRGYISQGLTGSETNLASAWSFNGAATDLNTTTPNNLTAQNGALATNADSPFGGQADGTISSTVDYAINQAQSYTGGNTTFTVQVPEGCTIPTTGGVTSVSYSSVKAPYGFPSKRSKWEIVSLYGTTSGINTFAAGVAVMSIPSHPVGAWDTSFHANVRAQSNSSSNSRLSLGLSTSATTITEVDAADGFENVVSAGGTANSMTIGLKSSKNMDITTSQTVYVVVDVYTNTTTFLPMNGSRVNGYSYIKSVNAYI